MPAINSWIETVGEGAAYVILAHEYAHAVQRQVGSFPSDSSLTIFEELHADCLAGSFFSAAIYNGVLGSDDFDAALETLFAAGDYNFDNPDHHGSRADRAAAFERGYFDLAACAQYLPAVETPSNRPTDSQHLQL